MNDNPGETKKLYRSQTDRQLAGVCGGVAEYFKIDPTIIRLGWIVIVVLTGIFPGVIAYFVMAVIIPNAPGGQSTDSSDSKRSAGDSSKG